MDIILYITFVLVSIGLIIIPGPNVLVIISISLMHGREKGLQTVAGTSMAMIIQLVIAAILTASLIELLSQGFVTLKVIGICYLIYLGVMQLFQVWSTKEAKEITTTATFTRGFIVSITNPKTILFFGAFLPQFVN